MWKRKFLKLLLTYLVYFSTIVYEVFLSTMKLKRILGIFFTGNLLWISFVNATLSDEELQIIQDERKIKFSKITEILSTKPYVEGINDIYSLLCLPIGVEGYKARKNFFTLLIEDVLKWLYDIIEISSASQKEERINESILINFMLRDIDPKNFIRFFKCYIGPFLIQPGFEKNQIKVSVTRKLQEIKNMAESEGIVYWLIASIEAQLALLEGD